MVHFISQLLWELIYLHVPNCSLQAQWRKTITLPDIGKRGWFILSLSSCLPTLVPLEWGAGPGKKREGGQGTDGMTHRQWLPFQSCKFWPHSCLCWNRPFSPCMLLSYLHTPGLALSSYLPGETERRLRVRSCLFFLLVPCQCVHGAGSKYLLAAGSCWVTDQTHCHPSWSTPSVVALEYPPCHHPV